MPATIHTLRPEPEPMNESDMLAEILADYTVPEYPAGFIATKQERAARYKRLTNDANARRARSSFHIV